MDRPRTSTTGGKAYVFDSVTSTAMATALDALSLRQRTIADNLANVNTPGFLAGRVQFEETLARAVAQGDGDIELEVARSLEPTRENGNNVNLDTETISAIDTNLRYQLATRAVDGTFSAVRTAMRTT